MYTPTLFPKNETLTFDYNLIGFCFQFFLNFLFLCLALD